jgi:hypothetical protein
MVSWMVLRTLWMFWPGFYTRSDTQNLITKKWGFWGVKRVHLIDTRTQSPMGVHPLKPETQVGHSGVIRVWVLIHGMLSHVVSYVCGRHHTGPASGKWYHSWLVLSLHTPMVACTWHPIPVWHPNPQNRKWVSSVHPKTDTRKKSHLGATQTPLDRSTKSVRVQSPGLDTHQKPSVRVLHARMVVRMACDWQWCGRGFIRFQTCILANRKPQNMKKITVAVRE